MNIILEGCDNVGKSTLINRLKEELPEYITCHVGPPPTDVDMDESEIVTKQFELLQVQHHTLYDRCFLGQFVYGPILRNVNSDYLLNWDAPNSLLVIIDTSEYILKPRYDDPIVSTRIMPRVLERFRYLYSKSAMTWKMMIFNDFEFGFLEEATRQIIRMKNRIEAIQR